MKEWAREQPSECIHHALDSILEMQNIEVDQQANSPTAESQVGEKLCFVNREHFLN